MTAPKEPPEQLDSVDSTKSRPGVNARELLRVLFAVITWPVPRVLAFFTWAQDKDKKSYKHHLDWWKR